MALFNPLPKLEKYQAPYCLLFFLQALNFGQYLQQESPRLQSAKEAAGRLG